MRRRRLFHLGLWGPSTSEGVDWEIEHHINERIDQLVQRGLSRQQAELEARRTFGDIARVRRELREIDREMELRMKWGQWLDTVLQDIRYGLRGVRRNPGFALALTLTLGLGIGANVAMFNVLDALLLRPLPYPAPEELVAPWSTDEKGEPERPYFTPPVARRLIEEQGFAAGMFAFSSGRALYLGGAEPVTLTVRQVTHEFEETLRMQPMLGRGFVADDERVGGEPVVLLDYGFWNSALSADRSIVNRTIELAGTRYTVIGVMPKGFKFPTYSTSEAWTPILANGRSMGAEIGLVELVARVPEERLAAAQSQLGVLATRLSAEAKPGSKGASARLQSIDNDGGVSQPIALLSGAVILILLIAGVNMVNLLLVRGSVRGREIAVRLAIGASRARLVRQLATEAMTLALLSGVVAVAVGFFMLRGISVIMPHRITFYAPFAIGLETRALTFTFLLTVICGFAFGLLPALLATRRGRAAAHSDLSRYSARTLGRTRLRRGLVIAEVTLSVMLLIAAGLFIRSFAQLLSVDPGFEPENLAILTMEVSSANHPTDIARGAYLRRLEQSLESVPGVESVALSSGLPPRPGGISFGTLVVAGIGKRPGMLVLPHAAVRPDFIEVAGARLLLGRRLTEQDDKNSVLVDEDFARAIAGSENPIGKQFRLDGWEWQTVIGVVKDMKMLGPDASRGDYALLQPATHERLGRHLAIAIRTKGDVADLLPSLRSAVHAVDRRQPILDLLPATTAYGTAIDMPRFLLVLISILAGVALVLASVGVYGVLAFGVSQRQQEIGVRMALGARPRDLNNMVVREGLLLAIAGTVLGLAAAAALSRFIRTLLFGVEPNDPATLIAVVAALIVAALLASVIPARRATRVSPLTALRSE